MQEEEDCKKDDNYRRIEHLFEQMSSNIQNSLAAFERRIESLESRQMLHASSGGASSSIHPPPSSSPQQLAQLMAECQRRVCADET